VLGDGDAMLEVFGKSFMSDHEDDDFKSLGTEVDEVKYCFALELFEAPNLENDQALTFMYFP
jgi:hypothetical protein